MSLIKHQLDLQGSTCFCCHRWFPRNQLRQVTTIVHKHDLFKEFVCGECEDGDRRDGEG